MAREALRASAPVRKRTPAGSSRSEPETDPALQPTVARSRTSKPAKPTPTRNRVIDGTRLYPRHSPYTATPLSIASAVTLPVPISRAPSGHGVVAGNRLAQTLRLRLPVLHRLKRTPGLCNAPAGSVLARGAGTCRTTTVPPHRRDW